MEKDNGLGFEMYTLKRRGLDWEIIALTTVLVVIAVGVALVTFAETVVVPNLSI